MKRLSFRTSVLAAILMGGCATPKDSSDRPRNTSVATAPAVAADSLPATVPDSVLISSSGIGFVPVGASLASVRAAHPTFSFARTSDGEGVALVGIESAAGAMIAYLGEEDPSAPIDYSRPVESLETMSKSFKTAEGAHVGALLGEIEKLYGKITRIDKSEIEQRQFVTFEKQPAYLTFRIDYTGIFEPDSMTTTRYSPEARIFSIAVRPSQGRDGSSAHD